MCWVMVIFDVDGKLVAQVVVCGCNYQWPTFQYCAMVAYVMTPSGVREVCVG